mmetsp:Transcript_32521/g.82191  ORF Transcript_32521/g.82191 Transcript_32521/m.82191 type:complete len:220 (-) Transcript_32521:1080-1739(-)
MCEHIRCELDVLNTLLHIAKHFFLAAGVARGRVTPLETRQNCASSLCHLLFAMTLNLKLAHLRNAILEAPIVIAGLQISCQSRFALPVEVFLGHVLVQTLEHLPCTGSGVLTEFAHCLLTRVEQLGLERDIHRLQGPLQQHLLLATDSNKAHLPTEAEGNVFLNYPRTELLHIKTALAHQSRVGSDRGRMHSDDLVNFMPARQRLQLCIVGFEAAYDLA